MIGVRRAQGRRETIMYDGMDAAPRDIPWILQLDRFSVS